MVGTGAAELHRRAVHDGDRGLYGSARRLLRTALTRDPDPVLRARILLSLAYYEAERSGAREGLALLDEAGAVPGLPDRIRGLVASQRGLVHQRAGAVTASLEAFDEALRLLGDGPADAEDRGRALLNRGIVHLQRGARAAARADFTACRDLADRSGLALLAAKAAHNLGYLSYLAGHLPRALQEMDAVAPQLGALSPMFAAVYHGDRAQVLLAAGLFTEADEDLQRAGDLLRAAGVRQELAEVELARARVALAQRRFADARRLAGRARRRFEARGSQGWPLLADQVRVAADVEDGVRLRAALAASRALDERLAALGLPDDARRSALTAATAALRLGDPALAREVAGRATRLHRDDPIRTRLQARTVRAGLATAEGRPAAATAELRGALADLHRYQATFGSLDLRTAVSGHGGRLAAQALRQALATGRPALVFAWAERARALSARLPPVVPPDDPRAAALLEDLRDARTQLRALDPATPAARELRVRCRRIEHQVRQRSWQVPGRGEILHPARLGAVRARLREAAGTLVLHLVSEGSLVALVATGSRQRLVPLGDAATVLELRRRVRADLDALAVLPPGPLRDGVTAAYRADVRRLDAALWEPLRPFADTGPLLLAPSAALADLPWTLLPGLCHRPVAVVSSASAWLAARGSGPTPLTSAVVVTAGPGVDRAPQELDGVAAAWARVLVLPRATPADVLAAAPSADVLHVAAHGTHVGGNPLFSHLDLHGGPLFGHDLEHLARLPVHVVLSACELGLSDARAGDETLGMTASLLHSGAGSVVAGVARVPDDAACRLAVVHHQGLRRGLPPATALAEALEAVSSDEAPIPFVCFGIGW